jgi:hypothetical protein
VAGIESFEKVLWAITVFAEDGAGHTPHLSQELSNLSALFCLCAYGDGSKREFLSVDSCGVCDFVSGFDRAGGQLLLRPVLDLRFAVVDAGLTQLIYLVLFSYAFFFEGFIGLAVTIGAILTQFVVMQMTGRIRWEESLGSPQLRKGKVSA